MEYIKQINFDSLNNLLAEFKIGNPFNHAIIDNFLPLDFALTLEREFPKYEDDRWLEYSNSLENKRALNDWNSFPPATYSLFSHFNSEIFLSNLSSALGIILYPDCGLHGGGWHIHGSGGLLNPHLDYSIHPKLNLQRRINIIIYLSRNIQESNGGHLGLWEHDQVNNKPGQLAKEVAPIFNRAVVFDTTQNSWHGFSRPLDLPTGAYRKSLAIYYLADPKPNPETRGRALFAARENQELTKELQELIDLRASVATSHLVYKK